MNKILSTWFSFDHFFLFQLKSKSINTCGNRLVPKGFKDAKFDVLIRYWMCSMPASCSSEFLSRLINFSIV